MYEIDKKLEDRQRDGNPINVGIIGAGQMGTEILTQISLMKGMEVLVVVDITEELASAAFKYQVKKPEVVFTNDIDKALRALESGKKIATTDYKLATRLAAQE